MATTNFEQLAEQVIDAIYEKWDIGSYDVGGHTSFTDALLSEVIAQITPVLVEKLPLNQRERDLLRYCRGELHREGLITDEEFTQILEWGSNGPGGGSPSARRLEDYDSLRAALAAKDREIAELKEATEKVRKEYLKTAVGWQELAKLSQDESLRMRVELDAKDAEIAALQNDKKRMDWLEWAIWNHENSGNGVAIFPTTSARNPKKRFVSLQGLGDEDGSGLGEELTTSCASLRAAIDSARVTKAEKVSSLF